MVERGELRRRRRDTVTTVVAAAACLCDDVRTDSQNIVGKMVNDLVYIASKSTHFDHAGAAAASMTD